MQNCQSNFQLIEIIKDQIANSPEQKITFADYMDLVLYHPQEGYYTSGQVDIGKAGDFFTAASLGSDFGELLAENFVEMWDKLGQPNPFDLVEMGAGKGELAGDIIRYLSQHYPQCLQVLHYHIIEQSPALREQQKAKLKSWENEVTLQWETWEEIPDSSLVGCCFSNELVDAFPVHRVQIEAGILQEIYVTLTEENNPSPFTEITDNLSTPQLQAYFSTVGVTLPSSDYPDGFQTEVNLAIQPWLATISRCLKQGYLLTIDYGYPAEKYYNPQRYEGTLQCYIQHQRHNDPYYLIGQQDITSHVDFTALETYGKQYDLECYHFTQQALFLMSSGLGDRLNKLSQGGFNLMEVLQQRDALHQLMDPMGLGGFGVLLQGKGMNEAETNTPLLGVRENQ
ncbi:MAG: class I SAM-dependent methyltransferase [Halothece sp. Uz-M2-17]|nr:class I SAM-dependent methyltransferase [Halothece sp. Uz-M2-17]